MPSNQTLEYRDHPAWVELQKIDAILESLADEERTENSYVLQEVVRSALRRRTVPAPIVLYADVLDALHSTAINYFSEATVRSGGPYPYTPQLTPLVRQLPQLPNRELPPAYKRLVDEVSEEASEKFARIGEAVSQSMTRFEAANAAFQSEVAKAQNNIEESQNRSDRALASVRKEIEDIQAQTREVNSTAAATMKSEWATELADWRERAIADRQAHDTAFRDELGLLVAAAQIGQRLVENAAGTLTALDWTKRASRERKTGNLMRILAIAAFLVAVFFGAWMVAQALREALTLGEGVLRVAVVAAVGGLGGYLGTESRRHLHEADSAEEVSTVIQQMEPFLAGSDDRQAVRREISDTVFVRNVLSRFTKRDAHGRQISEQNIPEVLSALTEAVKTLSATRRSDS